MDDDEEEALFDTDDEPETTEQDGPKLMKKNKSLQTTAMTAPCEEAKVEKKSFLAINSIPTAILRRQFNWPSCEEQNWRHLSNFIIRDRQGNMIDACMKGGSWKATGTLLARPGSNIPSLLDVEISFTNYSIDFGKSNDDPARGYWVQCSEFVDEDDDENDEGMATGKQKKKKKKGKPESVDVWYKFETPHKLYEKFAIKMEFLVNSYLKFHDVLTSSGPGSDHVTSHFHTLLITCPLTVQEFHRKTNKAFDLDFVRNNADFVLDHLKNTIDVVRSKGFLYSIRDLGKVSTSQFNKFFLAHFQKAKKDEEDRLKKIATEKKAMLPMRSSNTLQGRSNQGHSDATHATNHSHSHSNNNNNNSSSSSLSGNKRPFPSSSTSSSSSGNVGVISRPHPSTNPTPTTASLSSATLKTTHATINGSTTNTTDVSNINTTNHPVTAPSSGTVAVKGRDFIGNIDKLFVMLPPSPPRRWATNVLWADLVGQPLATYYVYNANDDDEEPLSREGNATSSSSFSSSSSSSSNHINPPPPRKGVLKPFDASEMIQDKAYEFEGEVFL